MTAFEIAVPVIALIYAAGVVLWVRRARHALDRRAAGGHPAE